MLQFIFESLPKRTSIEVRAFDKTLDPKDANYSNRRFFARLSAAQQFALSESSAGKDVSFGIAPRRVVINSEGNRIGTKEACSHISTLWVDLDDADIESAVNKFLLPPSFIVSSGYGFHLYWLLNEATDNHRVIESLNTYLYQAIGGDASAHNVDKLLRVPGTKNYKERSAPRDVRVIYSKPHFKYAPEDFLAARGFNPAPYHVEKEPDDRSKRDWGLVADLVKAGLTDAAITWIFEANPVGDKARETPGYLERTITRAREKITVQTPVLEDGLIKITEDKVRVLSPDDLPPVKTTAVLTHDDLTVYPELKLAKGPDGYYAIGKENTVMRLCPFIFDVVAMHVSDDENEPDIFVVNVRANNYTWDTFVLSAEAFNTATGFRKQLPRAAWVWPGSDRQTNNLRWLLTQEWLAADKPRIFTTKAVGRRCIEFLGRELDVFVSSTVAFDSDFEVEEEVLYTPPSSEKPYITFDDTSTLRKDVLVNAMEKLLKVNDPASLYPVLGWFTASHYKAHLALLKRRFPHLLVYGTKGAGKTTLITKVMQPLLGYKNAETWAANSTPFVLLTLLGATTTVPICLTEYRNSTQNHQERFLQMLRMAYDTGQDARGRADQTTQTYKLSSPVCIDGEEPFDDPAMVERTMMVYMNVANTARQSKYADAFSDLEKNARLDVLGAELCLFAMQQNVEQLYQECLELISSIFKTIPFRVANNFAITLMGLETIRRFCLELGMEEPFTFNELSIRSWFKEVLAGITENANGRPRIGVDDFVEDVFDHVAQSQATGLYTPQFSYRYKPNSEPGIFAFHVKGAYLWWQEQNQRRRTIVPAQAAIKRQLSECMVSAEGTFQAGRYVMKARNAASNTGRVRRLQYIDLNAAIQSGLDLDTPEPAKAKTSNNPRLKKGSLVIKLGG